MRTNTESIMDMKPEKPDNEDLLDNDLQFQSECEQAWEGRRNQFLTDHPYLCGYAFLVTLAVFITASHLMMFMLSFLFLYLISDLLTNDIRRYIPFLPKALLFSILYVIVIVLVTVISYRIIPNVVRLLPEVANQLQVQAIKQYKHANEKWNLTKYVELEEVKKAIVKATTETFTFLMDSITPLYKGIIYFIFALVVNLLLYHKIENIDQVFLRKPESLMFFFYSFVKIRVNVFYFYFKRVMLGQVIISVINTVVSAIAIYALGLPNPIILIFVVFFCGLFPVFGNIVSNTILTITAFISIGVWGAVICLILLVVIHKSEYFLNSKIIGEIVRLPMVITLIALIVSEVLLGLVGLILAIPLILFLRHELEHIPGIQQSKVEDAL